MAVGELWPTSSSIATTIQPDGTAGLDTRISQLNPTTNYGTGTTFAIGYRPANGDVNRTLIKFDISSIGNDANIASAVLSIYAISTDESASATMTYNVHEVTQSWVETSVTWNTQPTFSAEVSGSTSVTSNTTGFKSIDITGLVKDWISGKKTNNGLIIKISNEATGANMNYDSSEGSTSGQRPKLVITGGGVVGLWHLNGDANDSSGNGYNLTNNNVVTFPKAKFGSSGGNFVRASDQYLSIADASCPNLEIAGSQTWMGWHKPVSLGVNAALFTKYDGSSGNFKSLQILSANTYRFLLSGLTTTNVISDVTATLGQWHFICGVYDAASGVLKIWVNMTKKQVSTSGSATDTNGTFFISRFSPSASSDQIDGQLDEMIIFNRALSDKEIRDYYSWSIGRFTKVI